jgi:hypothetical protein
MWYPRKSVASGSSVVYAALGEHRPRMKRIRRIRTDFLPILMAAFAFRETDTAMV